jgi:hypothetical protein
MGSPFLMTLILGENSKLEIQNSKFKIQNSKLEIGNSDKIVY